MDPAASPQRFRAKRIMTASLTHEEIAAFFGEADVLLTPCHSTEIGDLRDSVMNAAATIQRRLR